MWYYKRIETSALESVGLEYETTFCNNKNNAVCFLWK